MTNPIELTTLAGHIRQCGQAFLSIADALDAPVPDVVVAEEPPKPLTFEDVRAVLAEKSENGHTEAVWRMLENRGAFRLSDVDPSEYAELLAEAEALLVKKKTEALGNG